MAKRRKTGGATEKTREANESVQLELERRRHEEDLKNARRETEDLRNLVRKMQQDNDKMMIDMTKNDNDKIDVTLRANVISTARKVVYPKCPYISTNEQLLKCTKIVGKKMNIKKEEFHRFVALYKGVVNTAITTRRNANIQQVRKKLDGKNIEMSIGILCVEILTFILYSMLNFELSVG